MDRHAQGILLIILSAIAYSSAGFFTRLIHFDAWTMLFRRGRLAMAWREGFLDYARPQVWLRCSASPS